MNPFLKELLPSSLKELLPYGDDDLILSPPLPPIAIDPSRYHTPDGQSGWTFESTGSEYRYFKYNDFNSAVTAYTTCPPVSAIINRKAQTLINGKVWVLNSKNKEAQGIEASKIRKLLKRPNPIQSPKQFEAQMYIYLLCFGFAIILPVKPFGFTDPLDTTSMWNIPASWIDFKATEERFNRTGAETLQEIVINFNGKRIAFKLNELIIVKDYTPSFNTVTFPGSRLLAQAWPINNILGALESSGTIIHNRGPMGILSSDPGKGQYAPLPLTKDQKDILERDFRRYGLKQNQVQVILTNASLKYTAMGSSVRDLMLDEAIQSGTLQLCAGLNFPPFILGLAETTYNNMTEAEKGLYTNATIPDAENIYEQLTNYFNLDNYNLHLDKDFSHIPVLQRDKGAEATARKSLNEALKIEWETGLITLDEWREKLGEDPLPEERGKLYYNEYQDKYGRKQPTQSEIPTNQGTEVGIGQAA